MHRPSGYLCDFCCFSTCLVSVRKVRFNMLKTDEFSHKNFTIWHINMKKRGKDGKNTLHVYILFTHEFVIISSVRFIPFSVFRFLVKVTKNEKNQLSYLFTFCEKKSHFAWKQQLLFLFFGHFDPKTKNGMNSTLKVLKILLLKGNFRKP